MPRAGSSGTAVLLEDPELEWAIATRPTPRRTDPARSPAQESLRLPAPASVRLGAALIDVVALTLPLIPVVLLGLLANRTSARGCVLVSTLALICWIVAALLYAVVGGGEGQTLGKRLAGILVVDHATGLPIGYERALVRAVVLVGMALPSGLGFWSVVSVRSDRHRGWHDRAAGSVVVRGFLS